MPDTSGNSPSSMPRTCDQCGAANSATRRECWQCGAQITSLVSSESDVNLFASPAVPEQEFSTGQNLSSLLLLVALAAICLGIAAIAPGLAIVLAVLAVPALIRTSGILGRRQQRGVMSNFVEKILLFVGSFGVILVIVVSVVITFFAICFGGGLGTLSVFEFLGKSNFTDPGLAILFGFVVGIAASLWVLIKLARRLWPYRED